MCFDAQGWTGEACDTCMTGYTLTNGACVQSYSPGGVTGPAGSQTDATITGPTSKKLSSGAIAGIIIALIIIIVVPALACLLVRRHKNRAAKESARRERERSDATLVGVMLSPFNRRSSKVMANPTSSSHSKGRVRTVEVVSPRGDGDHVAAAPAPRVSPRSSDDDDFATEDTPLSGNKHDGLRDALSPGHVAFVTSPEPPRTSSQRVQPVGGAASAAVVAASSHYHDHADDDIDVVDGGNYQGMVHAGTVRLGAALHSGSNAGSEIVDEVDGGVAAAGAGAVDRQSAVSRGSGSTGAGSRMSHVRVKAFGEMPQGRVDGGHVVVDADEGAAATGNAAFDNPFDR